jgi:hypothetical protein
MDSDPCGSFGTSVHNDKPGSPHKIRAFGIKQTNIAPHYIKYIDKVI